MDSSLLSSTTLFCFYLTAYLPLQSTLLASLPSAFPETCQGSPKSSPCLLFNSKYSLSPLKCRPGFHHQFCSNEFQNSISYACTCHELQLRTTHDLLDISINVAHSQAPHVPNNLTVFPSRLHIGTIWPMLLMTLNSFGLSFPILTIKDLNLVGCKPVNLRNKNEKIKHPWEMQQIKKLMN